MRKSGKDASSDGLQTSNWAQCNQCGSWRRLHPSTNVDSLPELWYCCYNHFACTDPEEVWEGIERVVSYSDGPSAPATSKKHIKQGLPSRASRKSSNHQKSLQTPDAALPPQPPARSKRKRGKQSAEKQAFRNPPPARSTSYPACSVAPSPVPAIRTIPRPSAAASSRVGISSNKHAVANTDAARFATSRDPSHYLSPNPEHAHHKISSRTESVATFSVSTSASAASHRSSPVARFRATLDDSARNHPAYDTLLNASPADLHSSRLYPLASFPPVTGSNEIWRKRALSKPGLLANNGGAQGHLRAAGSERRTREQFFPAFCDETVAGSLSQDDRGEPPSDTHDIHQTPTADERITIHNRDTSVQNTSDCNPSFFHSLLPSSDGVTPHSILNDASWRPSKVTSGSEFVGEYGESKHYLVANQVPRPSMPHLVPPNLDRPSGFIRLTTGNVSLLSSSTGEREPRQLSGPQNGYYTSNELLYRWKPSIPHVFPCPTDDPKISIRASLALAKASSFNDSQDPDEDSEGSKRGPLGYRAVVGIQDNKEKLVMDCSQTDNGESPLGSTKDRSSTSQTLRVNIVEQTAAGRRLSSGVSGQSDSTTAASKEPGESVSTTAHGPKVGPITWDLLQSENKRLTGVCCSTTECAAEPKAAAMAVGAPQHLKTTGSLSGAMSEDTAVGHANKVPGHETYRSVMFEVCLDDSKQGAFVCASSELATLLPTSNTNDPRLSRRGSSSMRLFKHTNGRRQ